jgi:hypothetical protein
MRKLLTVITGLLLGGCATSAGHHNDLAMQKAEIAAQSFCEHVPFSSLADCVRGQFSQYYPQWPSDSNADLVLMFISWTQAASQRVATGEMTEADAWHGAYQLYDRLKQLAGARYQAQQQAQQISSERAAAIMYAGLALIAVGEATRPAPGPVITCRGYWVGAAYYTTCQ